VLVSVSVFRSFVCVCVSLSVLQVCVFVCACVCVCVQARQVAGVGALLPLLVAVVALARPVPALCAR
jgi:hypothetical protein